MPREALLTDELLSIAEVCAELGTEDKPLSRATFNRWRATGRGPRVVKLPNGSVRIKRSALQTFIDSCEK